MMRPTYYDRLLGKAGTGARAYTMLEQVDQLSPSGKSQRQRVIDIIDAGLRAPWVGPHLPGSSNQHPDADIIGNLTRSGFLGSTRRIDTVPPALSMLDWILGLDISLPDLLRPIARPDETILAAEIGEDILWPDRRFQAIVVTSFRVLTLSAEPQGPGEWIEPVTDISIRWLDWPEARRALVYTAAEAPPCGSISVVGPETVSGAPTLHYRPATSEREAALPWDSEPPPAPSGTHEAVVEAAQSHESSHGYSPPPPVSPYAPIGWLPPDGGSQPYGYPPPSPVLPDAPMGRAGYSPPPSPFDRSDADVEQRLLNIGYRIAERLGARRAPNEAGNLGQNRCARRVNEETLVQYGVLCSRCHRPLPLSALFCGYCGQGLR